MDRASPLSSHITHLISHSIRISCRFRVRFYGRAFFFYSKRQPATWRFPPCLFSLALRFFLFLLHCIGPVRAPLAFRCVPPSPAMLSRSLVFSALLCSPTSLIPKPAMFEPTHPPTIGRREKACGPKASGHEHGALFCFICFTPFLFLY